jgi:hypothetical protein
MRNVGISSTYGGVAHFLLRLFPRYFFRVATTPSLRRRGAALKFVSTLWRYGPGITLSFYGGVARPGITFFNFISVGRAWRCNGGNHAPLRHTLQPLSPLPSFRRCGPPKVKYLGPKIEKMGVQWVNPQKWAREAKGPGF